MSLNPIFVNSKNISNQDINWNGIKNADKTFFTAVDKVDRYDSTLPMYSIISGPYNVDKEMNEASNAILIDIYEGSELNFNKNKINVNRSLAEIKSIYKLDSGSNVYRKMIDELIQDTRGIEQLSLDLTAARLLPTEFMLKNESHRRFKNMLLQQFNEVRLIDDMTKVNYEQVSAINRFSINESPMQNLSGRPGTGKSTIQHILVCEDN